MNTFLDNLRPELLEAKLNYIYLRWGIDREFLTTVIAADSLPGVGKNAKRRFRRYLKSLEQVFGYLTDRYDFEDMLPTDMFLKEYSEEIRRALKNEGKYLRYLAGDWDDEILRAVSIAQKKYVIPERVKTKAQQQPRVSFQPRSEYRNYLDK